MRTDIAVSGMTWSYSRLNTLDTCPYGWAQKYLFEVDEEDNFFSQYGDLMHSLYTEYFRGELDRSELPAVFLSRYFAEVTEPPPSPDLRRSYMQQGLEYWRNFTFPERKILGVELDVNFTFAGKPFRGYIDLLSEDKHGNLCITDHKSRQLVPRSRRKKPTKMDRTLDEYLRQLYIYAAAAKEHCGRFPDFLEFNCFRNGVFIKEPFDKQAYYETEAWAKSLISEASERADWPPHLDWWFCSQLCGVAYDCEYFARN